MNCGKIEKTIFSINNHHNLLESFTHLQFHVYILDALNGSKQNIGFPIRSHTWMINAKYEQKRALSNIHVCNNMIYSVKSSSYICEVIIGSLLITLTLFYRYYGH